MNLEEKLFGDPGIFAIHIKSANKPCKYFFRLFLNGSVLGSFRYAGYLDKEVKEFYRFLNFQNDLYEDKFLHMSDLEIYWDIVNVDSADSSKYTIEEQDQAEERTLKYYYMTDKLANNLSVIKLRREDSIIFIVYEMSGRNKINCFRFQVSYDYYVQVNREFVDYCLENRLLKSDL